MGDTFESELKALINKYSLENQSNTPDFLLAHYVEQCLANYATIVMARDSWHQTDPDA